MKLFKNDNGVSEIVGAMLILMILVIYLGILQGYEVPRLNKEIEREGFDATYGDFLRLRSGLEDVSVENMPGTASIHAGVRYPERFMLHNPGQGAVGSFTTYPLNINVSYNSNGTIFNINYTSQGLIYEMKGISDFPELIYEHGIIIREFGNWNYSDDSNQMITDNGFFIPFLKGVQPISSTEVTAFNILPVPQYLITDPVSSINVTLETRYPRIWADMPRSIPPGSQFIVENNKIKIINVSGFGIRNLSLPVTSSLSENNIYSGNIRFADADTMVYNITFNTRNNITNNMTNNITNITNVSLLVESSTCSSAGRYFLSRFQGCVDIPPSGSVQRFIIQDIRFGGSSITKELIFNVMDYQGTQFEIRIIFDSDANGYPLSSTTIIQNKPAGSCSSTLINGSINFTSCYKAANIRSPNSLTIDRFDSPILRAKFLIY